MFSKTFYNVDGEELFAVATINSETQCLELTVHYGEEDVDVTIYYVDHCDINKWALGLTARCL